MIKMNYGRVVFDLETAGFSDKIILGGAYNGRDYIHFTRPIELLDFCIGEGLQEVEVFAHNGGRFDNRILYRYLKNYKDVRFKRYMVINGGLIFDIEYQGCLISFKDSFLILDKSLSSLAKDFNVKHKKLNKEFDIQKWIGAGCLITDELKKYLRHDVLGLWEVLSKFESGLETELKLTMAGTAFNALLESEYQGEKIKDITKNYLKKEYEQDIRRAYRGGRTECFILEAQKDFYYYDVNSLYPSVMAKYDYPLGRYHKCSGRGAKLYFDINKEGVSLAKIKVPDGLIIPYLMVHIDKKMIGPGGAFEDWFTNFELREAKKLGYEVEILEGYYYEDSGTIFKKFVDHYKTAKEEAKNDGMRYLAKKFLNTSYGKWGQRREQTQILNVDDLYKVPDKIKDVEITEDLIIYKSERYTNRQINPVYAAYITAYARHELYKGMQAVGLENVVYCDTDSIMSYKKLPASMVDKSEFGKWSVEGAGQYQYGLFVAPKTYMILDTHYKITKKAKGIPYDKLKDISLEDFYKIHFQNKKVYINYKRIVGFLEKYKRIDTRNTEEQIFEIEVQKIIKDTYTKRAIHEDLIHTSPVIL
jgi:hypothetical protein